MSDDQEQKEKQSFGMTAAKENSNAKQKGRGVIKPSRRRLPKDLTSYDFLKALALIIMVIDHVGYYFFPEDEWFRAIGRWGMPVWFFLVGYARSRDLQSPIWYGLIILIWFNLMCGMYVFPMNALLTIILIRMFIDWFARHNFKSVEAATYMSIALGLLAIPVSMLFEYGMLAFLFALLGYAVRNRNKIGWSFFGTTIYALFCMAIFFVYTLLGHDFDLYQMLLFMFGTILMIYILLNFKRVIYKKITMATPTIFVWFIQIMGRQTLWIYVIHLALFKLYVVYSGDPRFEWFYYSLFPAEGQG